MLSMESIFCHFMLSIQLFFHIFAEDKLHLGNKNKRVLFSYCSRFALSLHKKLNIIWKRKSFKR